MIKRFFALLLFSYFFTSSLQAQNTWIRRYPEPNPNQFTIDQYVPKGLAATPDGGFALGSYRYIVNLFTSTDHIAKFNSWGGLEWAKDYNYMPNPSSFLQEGKLCFMGDGYFLAGSDYVRRTDLFGNQRASRGTVSRQTNDSVIVTRTNGAVLFGYNNLIAQATMEKIDSSTNAILWTAMVAPMNQSYMRLGRLGSIVTKSNGEHWMLISQQYLGSAHHPSNPDPYSYTRLWMWKVSATGQNLGLTLLPNSAVSGLANNLRFIEHNGQNVLIFQGPDTLHFRTYDDSLRLQSQASYLNTANSRYSMADLVVNRQGHVVLAGRVDSSSRQYAWIARFDLQTARPIWSRTYNNPYHPFSNGGFHKIDAMATDGYILFRSDSATVLYRTDSLGLIYNSSISGILFLDRNNNCLRDFSEPLMPNQIVYMELPNGERFYATTDQYGSYRLDLPPGNYVVNAVHPHNPSTWTFCSNGANLNLGNNQHVQRDLGVQSPQGICPILSVDLETPWIRRCFDSYYHVNYRNLGLAAATNAYVDITLDSYFSFVSSTRPATPLGNNTYRFQLGNVNISEQGSFVIVVNDSCRSVLGQVHCSSAHIYPDTMCNDNWTGPVINAEANCTGDSVQFRIRNGGGNMAQPLSYSIMENYLLIRQGTFQLNTNQDLFLTIPSRTQNLYRIEARQASGLPSYLGDSIAWSQFRGCPDSSIFVWTAPQAYYTNNNSPFVDINCETNRGSYDPNDKTPSPLGYGPNRYILPGTGLDYMIRFQNTGTDTAFRVVILDTLSPYLNPASLEMGASSHPYTWELSQEGILRITFFPIALTDTFTNMEKSMGFVNFRIQQQPGLPLNTRIENTAAIYFDYNEPIFTNTPFHILGRDFVVLMVSTEELASSGLSVKALPNPFQSETILMVEGQTFEKLELRVLDVCGRQIKQVQGQGNQVRLDAQGLTQGIYFYQLYADGQFIHAGKLILQP